MPKLRAGSKYILREIDGKNIMVVEIVDINHVNIYYDNDQNSSWLHSKNIIKSDVEQLIQIRGYKYNIIDDVNPETIVAEVL